MNKDWRGVPGFETQYMVSAEGVIRNRSTGKIVFGEIDRDGYRRVNLSRGGKVYKRRVHRLVCEAFHGPCPAGHECAHGDGCRLNNRADNLRWATRSENVQDSIAHGTFVVNGSTANLCRGNPNPRQGADVSTSKLTATDVRWLRREAAEGASERVLAKKYGVSRGQAHRIITRKAWQHVD